MSHLLESYKEQARRAHYNTSFSPEKRGDTLVQQHSEQLAADMREVDELGGDSADYRRRYEAKFSAWLSAKSRCISSMITGPARFPTRRAEKANNSETNHYRKFEQFRKKYMARLKRNKRREQRAQIDPVQEMRENIEQAEKTQALMIAANKIIRRKEGNNETVHYLEQIGITGKVAIALLVPDFAGRIGFPDYRLVNNSANIRRMRERLAELEKKAAAETKEQERPDGIRVVQNADADRLQVFFPGKPSPEMIGKLKSRAFKWSPSNGCWQRQLTPNAIYALEQIFQN